MRRALVIASLLAVAGVCGFLAYDAFSRTPEIRDRWAEAAASARRAEHTKGQLPSMQIRERTANLFLEIAASGPLEIRSQAAMLAGLLQVRNATADPAQRRELLIAATASIRKAIRLDAQNDDAAYDLELLLSQARASGQPISQQSGVKQKKRPGRTGKPGAGEPGTGY
jgi:hypothetical protein